MLQQVTKAGGSVKTASLPVDLLIRVLPWTLGCSAWLTAQGECHTPKSLRARQRTARHDSFACSLPSALSAWAAPPCALRPDGNGGRTWGPACSRGKLLLERAMSQSLPDAGAERPPQILPGAALRRASRDPRGSCHQLSTGTGTIFWAMDFCTRDGTAQRVLSLGDTHAFRAHSLFQRSLELDRHGWLHIPSLFYRVLTPFSAQNWEQWVTKMQSHCENFFFCPFRVPHSTAKKEWMQVLRGNLSPHYSYCPEGFKLQMELVEAEWFCKMMKQRRQSCHTSFPLQRHNNLSPPCSCQIPTYLQKRWFPVCLLGKNMKICP